MRLLSTSSLSDPEQQSLFQGRTSGADIAKAAASTNNIEEDVDRQLRADIKTMGAILGKIIKEHSGEDVFDKVETLRAYAKAWREAGAGRDASKDVEANEIFEQMSKFCSSLSTDELVIISRAFTHFCAIANAAEFHHRARRNEENLRKSVAEPNSDNIGALGNQEDSCGGVLQRLLNSSSNSLTKQQIYDTLTSQTVEIVLTAHPTEVNRRTLLDKHRRVQNLLTEADQLRSSIVGSTPYQRQQIDDCLHREIGLIWQSDELSRQKPTVQSEAERGTLIIETVLWDALPSFVRKLDETLVHAFGKDEQYRLPLTVKPFQFSSWMGGDRDGNPNVTPNVTREVCLRNRIRAADLFLRDLKDIAGRLSTTYCNAELRAIVGDNARAPYRAYLFPIIQKLEKTVQWAHQELERITHTHAPTTTFNAISSSARIIDPSEVYLEKQELMDEILLIHKSLCDTNNHITANARVLDCIRNLCAFGLTLVPLDIRQESTRHTEALDAITRHLGIGSYDQWDEATKLSWLQKELQSSRPLVRKNDWCNTSNDEIFSPTTIDTLETFQMIAEQYDGSLNAYVISQATSASDVLAVLLLQRDAGVEDPLRVVPLFETLDDLKGAADTMETLFTLPAYMSSIDKKQEVMIGYSDSAKDAGRLAASWAQYETQEQLANVAVKHDIDLTFFHGKGGTVGRGGNPATFNAILSHAPNTINGKFRVTEQGEMIHQNFGHMDRAVRTLDIYTAAVCAERHIERPTPSEEWRDIMNRLSEVSCHAYRNIVRHDDRFVPYFRSATPELELSELNIGSRPAKRKATGGVESLRAIPWIFAWTQTRLNLPTWLGVGEAIDEFLLNSDDTDDALKLRAMYKQWPSFRTTVDLVEMVLAKSEPAIAKHYEDLLVDENDTGARELGREVRTLHKNTERAVMDLAGHTTLCEDNHLLRRTLHVRNPYVDCLNVLQAETLKRMRTHSGDDAEKEALKDGLMISITGIANGMGNTG